MTASIMRQNLLVLAATYGALKGLAPSTVSQRIYGQRDFFDKYRRKDACPTVDKYFAIVDKFRATWPEGEAWPDLAEIPKMGKTIYEDEKPEASAEGIG